MSDFDRLLAIVSTASGIGIPPQPEACASDHDKNIPAPLASASAEETHADIANVQAPRIDLRLFLRALPVQPCGQEYPACVLPKGTYDQQGFGIPAEGLPEEFIDWSRNGWRLEFAPDADGAVQMVPAAANPTNEQPLRQRLIDIHVQRRLELTLLAWHELRQLLELADVCCRRSAGAKTPEAYMDAIKQNGLELRFVPEALKTPPLCMAAVRQNGLALFFVPQQMKTPELCLNAITRNAWALEHVPEPLKSDATFCLTAIRTNAEVMTVLPHAMCTDDFSRRAVEMNVNAFSSYKIRKSPELCMTAMRQKGRLLRFIPDPIKTKNICAEAIKNDGMSIVDVPIFLNSFELCMMAVQRNGKALAYVPERFKTLELCMEAVKQDGRALPFVPAGFKPRKDAVSLFDIYRRTTFDIPAIYMTAVQSDGRALEFVPAEFRTAELCRIAVRSHWLALKDVPPTLKTEGLCLAAVQSDARAFMACTQARTPAICMAAVRQDGMLLEHVPDAMKTAELCMVAVKQNGIAVKFVPDRLKTLELCTATMKQHNAAGVYTTAHAGVR